MTSGLETLSLQQGSNTSHLSWKENHDLFKPSCCQTWKTTVNNLPLTVLTVTTAGTSSLSNTNGKLLMPFREICLDSADLKCLQCWRQSRDSDCKLTASLRLNLNNFEAEYDFFQHSFSLKVNFSRVLTQKSPWNTEVQLSTVAEKLNLTEFGRSKMLQGRKVPENISYRNITAFPLQLEAETAKQLTNFYDVHSHECWLQFLRPSFLHKKCQEQFKVRLERLRRLMQNYCHFPRLNCHLMNTSSAQFNTHS